MLQPPSILQISSRVSEIGFESPIRPQNGAQICTGSDAEEDAVDLQQHLDESFCASYSVSGQGAFAVLA